MKRQLLAVSAVCLAVLSGVAAAQVNAAEPIKTTLCKVKTEPDRFNGRIIQVRARIETDFEYSNLFDKSCGMNTWLEWEGQMDTESGRRAQRFLGEHYYPCPGFCRKYKVLATVIGRFETATKGAKATQDPATGIVTVPLPIARFGHMGGWSSQLVLQSISDVTAKPIKRSVYDRQK
jgi:hypothetical protein